jgi:hypothetical protein
MPDAEVTRVATVLLALLGAGAPALYACGASPTPSANLTPDGGGGGQDSATDVSSPQDGSTEGASDGAAHDGPRDSPEDLSTDTIVVGPDGGSLCNLEATWGAPTTVLTTASADATIFGAVTPDELTLAWTSSVGGTVTAWTADRASSTAAFGSPQALSTTFGALAMDRVTLSGDGLRIAGVASNGQSFVAATRTARPDAFATADTEFASLGSGAEAPPTFGTPLLAGNDTEFLYLITNATTDDVLYESTSGLPAWSNGAPLSSTQLTRSGTSYRRPSGLSLDDLTLFYWDEVSGSEKITTRLATSQPFSGQVDIGALTNAVPTASCTRIYYAVPGTGAGSISIVYADGITPDD